MEPVYAAARGVLVPLVRHGLRSTVEGRHMIPRHGPAVVASSHSGYLDPLILGYLLDLQGRRARFLAKRELFEQRGLGWALRRAGQIPVDRGTAGAARALDEAVEALRRGEVVVIFPEGTISLDLDPMPGKKGAARLASRSGVPVTPVGLWGSHRILFKGRPPSWRLGVAETICVGPPVAVGPEEDLAAGTDRIMEAVAARVRRARELYPQRPEPGEDDWWVRPPETAVLRSCRPRGADGPAAADAGAGGAAAREAGP